LPLTIVAAASRLPVAEQLMVGGIVEAWVIWSGDRDDVVHNTPIGGQAQAGALAVCCLRGAGESRATEVRTGHEQCMELIAERLAVASPLDAVAPRRC
jgi:hypothetical protein